MSVKGLLALNGTTENYKAQYKQKLPDGSFCFVIISTISIFLYLCPEDGFPAPGGKLSQRC